MAKILIVDDEPSINNLIKKHLELVGHSCQSAFDGEQALKLLQEEEPDIVLLDIMLPKLNGHTVMGKIQSVPVIFITARDNVMEKIQGFDEGDNRTVDVHIQKLRKKLGLEEQIKTVYKIGYRLEAM